MRLKYSNPMHLDDVAVDFPDMKIILAHPSFPWTEEGLAVRQHQPNVYYDMSGWSPKYFPDVFIRYANSILKRKMLFGSDWPAIKPDRWLADFEAVPFKDEVRPLILKENALRLLLLVVGPNLLIPSLAGGDEPLLPAPDRRLRRAGRDRLKPPALLGRTFISTPVNIVPPLV